MAFGTHLTEKQKKRAFVSMLIMVPLGGAATDIYIPSLPAMMEHFKADDFAIQSTLIVYMICYGVGQIIAGPLTDSTGRRMPIVLSTVVFVVASAGIASSPPLWAVILLRAIQGLSVACSAVGARAIVADCYDGDDRSRASNWMTIAWATGPILSPALGGYLQSWYGWTASFWFLTVWAVVVVLVALLYLPETRASEHKQSFGVSLRLYRRMITDPVYVPTALAMACLISVMYGFEMLAPFYIQNGFHHSPIFYGQIQLVLGCLWLGGNFFNRFASARWSVSSVAMVAIGTSLTVSALMLFLDLSGVFNLLALILPAGLIYFMMAIVWPNGYSKCLGRFQDAGGCANALVSGLFVIMSAVFTACASLLETHSAWPLWLLYVCVSAIALVLFVGFLRSEFSYRVR